MIYGKRQAKHTSVRADSSASRGRAEENTDSFRLMLSAECPVSTGDKLYIKAIDKTLMVNEIQLRMAIGGELDHLQVDAHRCR